MPANYFHVTTGAVLSSMKSMSFSDNANKFVALFALQFLALLPTLLKSKLQAIDNAGPIAPNPKRES